MGDERPLPVGRLAPGNGMGQLEDGLAVNARIAAAADGFSAVLEGGVKPGQAVLVRRGVVRQHGDREEIDARQVVDQPRDTGDVRGGREPFLARDRINDPWSRAGRDHQRGIVGNHPVKFGLTRKKFEPRRNCLQQVLDYCGWEGHSVVRLVHVAPALP